MNLKQETLDAMAENGMVIADIAYVSNRNLDQIMSVEDFFQLADREYNNSASGNEVNTELLIVFTNGDRLIRGSYDNNEWWEFIQAVPTTPPPIATPLYIWPEKSTYGLKDD
ncbi:MAG: hypothetical protein RSC68_13335 [Acinetobacter sp.]